MIFKHKNAKLYASSEKIDELIPDHETLNFTLQMSLKNIRSLTGQIEQIETYLMDKVQLTDEFSMLQTIPGVGKILGMTIMLETGNIGRFSRVGNYTSYCRCTSSSCTSNGKCKGKNNAKNGNKFLSWALVEAASQIVMHYSEPSRFYQRKKDRKNGAVAIKAIASKLSKAIYFMLKKRQPFDMKRVFG